MEELQLVQNGLSGAIKILQLVAEVKNLTGSKPIAALFEWDDNELRRLHGGDQVQIETHRDEKASAVTWFSVKEKDEYTFLRFPVIESSTQELLGTEAGEDSPDTRYWRWIARPREGVIMGGNYDPPNIKMQFVVIGYKPKELIDSVSS